MITQRAQRSKKFEISSEIENFERDWNFRASHPPRPYFLWGNRDVEIEILDRDQKFRSRSKILIAIKFFWSLGPLGMIIIVILFCAFLRGRAIGGREENRPERCSRGKRHDNKILKVQILLSRNFVVIARGRLLEYLLLTYFRTYLANCLKATADLSAPRSQRYGCEC